MVNILRILCNCISITIYTIAVVCVAYFICYEWSGFFTHTKLIVDENGTTVVHQHIYTIDKKNTGEFVNMIKHALKLALFNSTDEL